jgi:branched-chain amino acid transport system permease protein
MEQQIFNAFILGSVLLLFALGLSLAWGTLDVLNLAHGALFVFGGYLGSRLGTLAGLSFVPVLILVMVSCGLAAAFIELVAFGQIRKRITRKSQAEMSVMVASLGASIAINQIVTSKTDGLVFSPPEGLFTVRAYDVLGLRITNIAIVILAFAAVIAVGLSLWNRYSRQGRAARAVAYSPGTAELMGINVRRVGLLILFMSGALAGLAGFLLSFQISGQDVQTGATYMVVAFSILVLGGVGSVLGATLAAYVIAVAQTLVGAYGPSGYQDAVAYGLIFIMLLVRPQGLIARRQSERA